MHISDHAASNENVLDRGLGKRSAYAPRQALQNAAFGSTPPKALRTDQMRILQLFHHLYIIELDVEILIDRFQGSANLDIILELDGDFVIDQGLEETDYGGQTSARVLPGRARGSSVALT